jgi:hypothetical protein
VDLDSRIMSTFTPNMALLGAAFALLAYSWPVLSA